jgi:hypothetical protein
MAILPIDTWNPKCIPISKYHWVHCRKKTPSHGIASNTGKPKFEDAAFIPWVECSLEHQAFCLGVEVDSTVQPKAMQL